MTVECEICNREFVNWHAASQHMNAVGHWACDSCTQEFWTQGDAATHMEYCYVRSPSPQFECEACDAEFDSMSAARQHMEARNHWREHWCQSCEKGFQNKNNLKMHLNSRIHRGSNITCPFCRKGFTTATGVATHLESGSCPNARNLNHATILAEIRRRDPHHVVTKKLLTYPSETPSTITVTSAAYNHDTGDYECYLCHRGFGSLHGLNQHVNSPAHMSKVYHCPGRACSRDFTALAGLFNHLESETCGAVRFEAVQRNVSGFLSGRRTIGFV